MPSHMSSIGFPTRKIEAFNYYLARTIEAGETISTQSGFYIKWEVGNGVELWVQANRDRQIIGLNPHFSGSARMRVGLTARISRPESILDGAFRGWVDPPETDNPEMVGRYPLVFDLPDYALYSSLSLPTLVTLQLTAFAEELKAFDTDQAYYDSWERERKFAAECFIPGEAFSQDGESTKQNPAHAFFSGHILAAERVTNQFTNYDFYWAKVRTYGGEVDVVADPELIESSLIVGGVVSGTFWLSGRLQDTQCAIAP